MCTNMSTSTHPPQWIECVLTGSFTETEGESDSRVKVFLGGLKKFETKVLLLVVPFFEALCPPQVLSSS